MWMGSLVDLAFLNPHWVEERCVCVHMLGHAMLEHACDELVLYIEESNWSVTCGVGCIPGPFEYFSHNCVFPFLGDGTCVPAMVEVG